MLEQWTNSRDRSHAYAREIHQDMAIAAGSQRHIPKPVEPDKLIEVIVELTALDRLP